MFDESTATMTIGAFAQAANVGVETVRFYQRRGLLPVPTRAVGSRRYGAADLRRLRFVRSAQRAGFTLAEVARLIDLDRTGDRAEARALAESRIAALDEKIASLVASRDALRDLATRCGDGNGDTCPILEAFEAGRL